MDSAASTKPSRVRLLDLSSGQTRPLFRDEQMLGYAPRWSPDETRLGYFDPQGGVRVVELEAGTSELIPNQLGEMGTWSPDGQALVVVDLAIAGMNRSGETPAASQICSL